MSIAQATGALVGNALEAGLVDEAKRVLKASIWACVVVMGGLGLLFIVGASPIVVLFNVQSGSELHGYAVSWMWLLGFSMPVVGVYISLRGLLSGAGATRTTLRINLWSTLLMQIPGSYVLGFPLGLSAWGIWFAFPLSFVLKALWAAWEVRRGRWAKIGLRA